MCLYFCRAEGAREFYEGDSDSEDEVFFDPDADPTGRKVYDLDGMEEGPPDDDDGEEEAGAGMALRVDGYSDGRGAGAGGDEDEEGMEEDDEPATDMCAVLLQGHAEQVYAVAVNPTNPDMIATASGDDTGGIWSRSTGAMVHKLEGHTDTVVDVAFSSSGAYLATAGMDSMVMASPKRPRWPPAPKTSDKLHLLIAPGQDLEHG